MMKKYVVLALLVSVSVFCLIGFAGAADWSRFESGRNNIRLDGYLGQPGYIELQDGNGNIQGYIWMSPDRGLVWCTPGAIDLTTTQLSDVVGVSVSTAYSGESYAN